MTWSIRARLTAWYSAIVIAALLTGGVAIWAVQARLELSSLDGELGRLLLTVEAVMRTEFGKGLTITEAAVEARTDVFAPDRALFLMQPDGTLLARWGGADVPANWAPAGSDGSGPRTVTIGGQRWREYRREVGTAGRRYVAGILAPLDALEHDRRALLVAVSVGAFVALFVAALGGAVIARKMLHPLEDMARQATFISGQDPVVRLSAPDTTDELGRLGSAFNALLDRLSSALRSQRQFMADASHELRTPVSVVRTAAQVTLARSSRPEREYRESLTIIAEQSARLTRLVDAMFFLSRAEAQPLPLSREPLYLDDLVSECVRASRVVASQRDIEISLSAPQELQIWGDDALLHRMIGNLLDNAVRHAASHVLVRLQQTGTEASISVRDDGDGVPAADRERIFERFVRVDAGPGGAGLGLPIARRIAEAHGGRLVLEEDGAGACFTVILPFSTAPAPVRPAPVSVG
jgi:signal transduction histidine kinase